MTRLTTMENALQQVLYEVSKSFVKERPRQISVGLFEGVKPTYDDYEKAAIKYVLEKDTFDPDKLARLLNKYQDPSKTQEQVAIRAWIQPASYSRALHGKTLTEMSLLQLCVYHKLNYKQAKELLAAGGYNIDCVTSIPMTVFRSFLKLREKDTSGYDFYSEPYFFILACKEAAKKHGVTLSDKIFKHL